MAAIMQIERTRIPTSDAEVPAFVVSPASPRGAVVLMHGYGGNKEEQLGFGCRIAEAGFAACVIDLCGHGDHPKPMSLEMVPEANAVVEWCRKKFGPVTAIGHSLGGRVAFLCKADFAIGLGAPMHDDFSAETIRTVAVMRSYRARDGETGGVFELLKKMPMRKISSKDHMLIVVGGRDIPETLKLCRELKAQGAPVIEVEQALHSDLCVNNRTFEVITRQLNQWYDRRTL